MGKRKSSKPPPKKQKPKLEKFFSCPFCNSDKTVSATFDWERQIGTVNCTVCQVSGNDHVRRAYLSLTKSCCIRRHACCSQANYSTQITHLSEPIDVYRQAAITLLSCKCWRGAILLSSMVVS